MRMFFGNLRFIWKFSVLAAMIPLVAISVAGIGILSAGSLKAQYDNLYGFMLVPIYNLEEANAMQKNMARDLDTLARGGVGVADRAAIVSRVQEDDKQITAIVSRYDNEWVS